MSAENIEKPSQDLYIYYLNGHIKPDNENFGHTFIGNWQEEGFSFLFFSEPAMDQVKNVLHLQSDLTFLDKYHMTYAQWHGREFTPLRIGRFFIIPPWVTAENSNELTDKKLRIILNPGVVFGTGTHPTTHDSLEALEIACDKGGIDTLIDLGTGTGLLAIAAVRLGCKRALAVDYNHLATRTAKNNLRLNRLEDKILVVQGSAEIFMDITADLVIANIHYDIMDRLVSSDGFLSKKWFILSGLLRSQAKEIDFRLTQYPVRIIKKWNHGGIWHTFLGRSMSGDINMG